MFVDDPASEYRLVDQFTLADLEAIRVVLRGGSVIDWHRLNFRDDADIAEFLRTHEFDIENDRDLRRIEEVKLEAIDYLRRNFEFPIPASIEDAEALELFRLASSKGHKQVCACIVLKAMHIIHHLQGRELLFMLPLSDAQVFRLVEEKVFRVVGGMLAAGLPIVEFLGGRKNRDSLYTKLLSKSETIAAQIYDKLRFRIVTRTRDDLFPVMNLLSRRLFPYNYAIPGQSTNTLVDFPAYCRQHPQLEEMLQYAQGGALDDSASAFTDNVFSAKSYRVIHFVVDLPVRVPAEVIAAAGPNASALGHVIFALVEFQIVDQATDATNEMGDASHARYKERQRLAVMDRLRMGFRSHARKSHEDKTMEHVAAVGLPVPEPVLMAEPIPPMTPLAPRESRPARPRTSRPPKR
ncbi:MAG: TIGR04552 family protein [Deltaproteobacteria bacterium]